MAFNRYAAGSKTYNGVSKSPHSGGGLDPSGYAQRDREYQTRKKNNALLRRIQARQGKRYMSSDNLSSPTGRTL